MYEMNIVDLFVMGHEMTERMHVTQSYIIKFLQVRVGVCVCM